MDVFFLLFGLLIFCVGLYWIISDYYQSKNGYHTKGKVIKIVGKWSAAGGSFTYLFYPLVQFTNQENEFLELKLDIGVSIPLYNEGQSVRIVYYKNKIHPTGIKWKIFYWLVLLTGISIAVYHILLLSRSTIWDTLSLIWRIFERVF